MRKKANRRVLGRRALVAGVLGVVFSMAGGLVAAPDEGMWLLTQVDQLELEKKGLEIPVSQVYDPGGPALFHAAVQLGGGSGEFVSSQGLILTNHHVAFTAIQALSSEEDNYVDEGFHARSLEEEGRSDYRGTLTLSVEDVTDQVLAGLPECATESEREDHVTARREEIAERAKAEAGAEDHSFRIVEYFNGATYLLYRQIVLRDIRLVHAPPRSIGEFGGDFDNFMWPRHCADFAFMRAYVAPDGSPAEYSEDNVPYQPEVWLRVSVEGVKDGDFTFVIGHPGRTMRQRSSFSMRRDRDVLLPRQITQLQTRVDRLEEESAKTEATRLANSNQLKGLNNTLKNFVGKVEGMARYRIVEREEAEERELREWLDAHPEQVKQYGSLLEKLADAVENAPGRGDPGQALANLELKRLRRLYHEARVACSQRAEYPDANGTIRFTHGRVRGYRPRDGVWYDPLTTLSGVVEKETGEDPFASPEMLLDLHADQDFGQWCDPELDDVPVAFIHDVDVTGGNSGSPVLNARGELVGVVFDGNYESLTADYHFIPELNRTVSVDIRYVLFLLEIYSEAFELLEELGI